jgi:hypothetical protein
MIWMLSLVRQLSIRLRAICCLPPVNDLEYSSGPPYFGLPAAFI